MKKSSLVCSISIIGFFLLSSNLLMSQAVELQWNTFLGSVLDHTNERGYGITRDSSGNIYVSGSSEGTWGSPVNAHSGGNDAFIACLDSSGSLVWNTFLGSSNSDICFCITIGSSGNIYISGYSITSWGSPVNAHSGLNDFFVACLNSSGNLLWNTFLGSSGDDYAGYSIVLDSLGKIYVTGYSDATWGTPVNAHSGNDDAFVGCLNSSGTLIWNTFLGSSFDDRCYGLTLDGSGNSYIIGHSEVTWGSPVNLGQGGWDVFVASLDSSGNLVWNSFCGGPQSDQGYGIAFGNPGYIYITGFSQNSWGFPFPINAHSGSLDAFVACLDGSGNGLWNTFLGSGNADYGYGIKLDNSGNIFVTGHSDASWGSPVNAHSGEWDVFLAGLNSSGTLLWNTFLGSSEYDWVGYSIAIDNSGKIFMTGSSWDTWGSPIDPYGGSADVFVAMFSVNPISDITANGSDGPISIAQSDILQIRVSLNTFGSTKNVDFWLAYKGPSGWVHYNNSTKKWEAGLGVTHQGPLMDLNNKKVFQSSELAPGNYTFYFGVDMVMDGKVTKSSLYKDEVKVTVTE